MEILDSFRLDGQTALVTGCRHGIGKALALGLAEAGADIIGVSRTLKSDGSDIAEKVQKLHRNFRGYDCDFKDRGSVYGFLDRVCADFPAVDILVNNAGTILRKPAIEHTDAYWDEVLEINLNAQFVLSRELGKRMVERGFWKDHLHRIAPLVPGWDYRAQLCRIQRGPSPS